MGFRRFYPIGFNEDLAKTFQSLRAYTSILEKYQEGSLHKVDLCEIGDQRNLIQHRLMSLPSAAELEIAQDNSNNMYETWRLAAIIFSVGVTFPLPGPSVPLHILARLLQSELNAHLSCFNLTSTGNIHLLIWALTLGGIAATNSPERTWFVEVLRVWLLRAHIYRWQHLTVILREIVWLDSACNHAGQQLWDELGDFASGRSNIQSEQTSYLLEYKALPGRNPPCNRCRIRKTKCDRRNPCQNCEKAGFNCQYQMLRGYDQIYPSAQLRDRVDALERGVTMLERRLVLLNETGDATTRQGQDAIVEPFTGPLSSNTNQELVG